MSRISEREIEPRRMPSALSSRASEAQEIHYFTFEGAEGLHYISQSRKLKVIRALSSVNSISPEETVS